MLRLSSLVFISMLSIQTPGAFANEIRAIALTGTREAVEELVPTFEKRSGHHVTVSWMGSVDARKRVGDGEPFDVVITARPDVDAFVKQGRVVAEGISDLMSSGIGIAVRQGLARPDVSTPDGLKAALLSAKSVGYSTGLSGTYVEAMLKRMGLFDQLREKLKQAPPSVSVGKILVSGEADIGFQQIPEIFEHPGVSYLGPLPPELQNKTQFSAGVSSTAKETRPAHQFINFLSSPEAADAIRRHGMEPG